MNDIVALVLQAVGMISGVIGVMYRIQKGQAARHQEEMKELKDSLKTGLEGIETLRREGEKALHERINNFEAEVYQGISNRLSHIEGELEGISNGNQIMQEWLVNHGGKVE